MNNWKEVLIPPNTSLRKALEVIDRASSQIALVVDDERHLLGTLCDGDIRRALLHDFSLSDAASAAMHTTPITALDSEEPEAILNRMKRNALHQIPIIDRKGVVVGLRIIDEYLSSKDRENWVIIMAGGLGSRLKELTEHTPKPMLKVGSRPLLETIIRSYADCGFRNIYLSVNYKADQIEAYFGDGRSLDVEIRYLREPQRLGTAGALSLLPERPDMPFVVTNGDILTTEHFGRMMDAHLYSEADATLAIRNYEIQVPFGVVKGQGEYIDLIDEKPILQYRVSAGMQVLSPEVLELIPKDQYFDMPWLFKSMVDNGMRIRSHQVEGYWLDIGHLPDYERANVEFSEVFND